MLEILEKAIIPVYNKVREGRGWDSLIINRRKPHTYRIFQYFEIEGKSYRICLHKFEPCDESDAFMHPHPWPGAFLLLEGSYKQTIAASADLFSPADIIMTEIIQPYNMYEITNRRTWHSVQPLTDCYTVMVNDEPWEHPHKEVRTTKGKDLDKMCEGGLKDHLDIFEELLQNYLEFRHSLI